MKPESMSGLEAWEAIYRDKFPPTTRPICQQAFEAGIHHAIEYVRSCQDPDHQYQDWKEEIDL
jgi:hypothetical protein